MRSEKELKKIWNDLNENERFGCKFGLFPIQLKDLDKDECVELMKLSEKETGKL